MGETATLSGTLMTSGGTALVSKTVRLETSADGTSGWTAAGTGTTSAGGTYSFVRTPTAKTYYRVSFDGDAGAFPCTSPVVSVAPKYNTMLTLTPSATEIVVGGTVTLSGTLKTSGGTALVGRTVRLETSADGSTGWTVADTIATSGSGSYAFVRSPTSKTYYRAVFDGDSETFPCTSQVVEVTPKHATVLTLIPSAAEIVVDDSVTLSGTLKRVDDSPIVGASVYLESSPGAEGPWLRDPTPVATAAGGGFAFTRQPASNTYYRAVFDGDTTNRPTTSDIALVVVKTATTLNLHASASEIVMGLSVELGGILVSDLGALAGQVVRLEISPNGSTGWASALTTVTAAGGTYSFHDTPSEKTYYRSIFDGDAESAAATSSVVSVTPKWESEVTIAPSGSEVELGDPVTLAGTLSTSTGTMLAGRTVWLETRPEGSDSWSRDPAATVTSAEGGYSFDHVPSVPTTYRVAFDRDAGVFSSTSSSVNVAPKYAVVIALEASDAEVVLGTPVTLFGTLGLKSGTPLVGQSVHLEASTTGSEPWVRVDTVVTEAPGGGFMFAHEPAVTTYYRVAFDGDAGHLAGASPSVQVTPRDAATLTLVASGSEIEWGSDVTLTASLAGEHSGQLAGRGVRLEVSPDGLGGWEEVSSGTTAANGELTFVQTLTGDVGSAVHYRAVFDGDASVLPVTSESQAVTPKYVTTIVLGASVSSVELGSSVTLSGILARGEDVALPDKSIALQSSADGLGSWSPVAGVPVVTTSATGAFAFQFAPTVSRFYRAVFAGDESFLGVSSSSVSVAVKKPLPVHRFYNVKKGVHFYTASEAEKNNVIANLSSIYKYEGVAYHVSKTPANGAPVYRFYNVRQGVHFYTASEAEKNHVIANLSSIYKYEGVGYYIGN